ncbi:hypothetical protein H8K52_05220 [Undibacterium seohonense]|uniref:Uncharacterized protein n=1 Tax=Undibacterium seohonense TaxID=1344950 RepID=A0ABR6X316_9BURK|nr:hypothetical protein [Undibacterium seohonense]MBC3806746.1 hypothetical protein [Undibacterium seohonense]
MLTCYLDSQDYSVLTDPHKSNHGLDQIRGKLLEFASNGEVQFVFSTVSVSETVATSAEASKLAQGKAELLSSLCGSNALISPDRLLDMELHALQNRALVPKHVIDPDGNWFPDIPDIPEMIGEKNSLDPIHEVIHGELNQAGLSRKERRAKARILLKNGKPRKELIQQISKADPQVSAKAMIELLPMKLEFAEVISRHCLGLATEQEFRDALLSSLRDPKFMMQWFTTNFALSSPISEIVRSPGRELGEQLRQIVEVSVGRTELLLKAGGDVNPTSQRGIIFDDWSKMVDSKLVGIFNRAAKERSIELGDIDARLVEKYCPGITTTIKSLLSSVWENIGGGRKKLLEDSQPVDALHAMYAPYVKVFRGDRFMSPLIQAQVKHRGTIVVPKLESLIGVLEQEIRSRV